MNFYLASFINLFHFFFIVNLIISYASSASLGNPYDFIGDVAINCGSVGYATALDGREWIGDTSSKYSYFPKPKGKSRSSTAVHKSFHADPVPSMTARISSAQFHYSFQLNPGQIFIRLHFYPALYRGFEKSFDFFTVKAGPFTFLSNFSASLAADALGVKYFVKEYSINVEEDRTVNIVFLPSKLGKLEKTHAFINGIEILSVPTGLYFTNIGAHIVGQNDRFYIDSRTAIETVQRLNIGGNPISPAEDSGLYRRWSADVDFLMESEVKSVKYGRPMVKIQSMPLHVAPLRIYQTSWSTNPNKLGNKMYNLTWKIPVNIGFRYLIRLHFCKFDMKGTNCGQRKFNISVNKKLVETNANIVQWSGGNGIPVYKDYMVILKGNREEGNGIILVTVQSKIELIDGPLCGLEILKLSNPDNNLASPGPKFSQQASLSWISELLKLIFVCVSRLGIPTSLTIAMILINIIVYHIQKFQMANSPEIRSNLVQKDNSGQDKYIPPLSIENEDNDGQEKYIPPAFNEQLCHHFSFAEIQSATQNFNDEFLIGNGGFGKVFKGFIDNGDKIVAIRLLNPDSKQGAQAILKEIGTLSKLRHIHLVSLIGYCDESQEIILVYEYMSRGSLAFHLYGNGRSTGAKLPLTWVQRLRICIGAARGLDYLHTSSVPGVIHHDVKDSNILLDENLVAKVSDFGIAKLDKSSQLKYTRTSVEDTFGYLDPHYFLTHELKSDVYAFGVVMLVVLSGRPAEDRMLSEDQSLVFWAKDRIGEGEVDQIIDTTLRKNVSSDSLKAFVDIARKCLNKQPGDRPTMAQVVAGLELALQQEQQQNAPPLSQDIESVGRLPNLESTQQLQLLHSVLEEMSDVGGPDTKVTVEKYEMEHSSQENLISTSEVVMRKNKPNDKALFRRSKRDKTFNSKPARRRPWYMLWTRARPSNATELYTGGMFKLKHIKDATKNFDVGNKLGEGGFGPVYKGTLPNGTEIAVKKLSARSRQGVREFVNEIGVISTIQHQNLVRLFGSVVERNELLLIYEYMKNNSLQHALFGQDDDIRMRLNWQTRVKIWLGVAKGLAFLHEESKLKFVHRDVKTSNILLDEEFNAKLSDFGLARLYDDNETHVSTRIAGTIGYMAPEYAMRGYLTIKADVYSFGIVMLEIVSGRRNFTYNRSSDQHVYLLDEAYELQKQGNLLELVDPNLRHQCSRGEAATVLDLAISCTNPSPTSRPTMSEIVKILEGKKNIGSLTMTMPLPLPAFSQSRESSSNSQLGPSNTNTIVSHSSIEQKDQTSPIVSHSSIKQKEQPSPFHSLPFFKKATRPAPVPIPESQEKSTPNDRYYYTFY